MRGNVTVSNPVFSGFLATLTPQLPSTSSLGRKIAMRFKFQARHTRRHSPLALFNPRRRNWRKPRTD